jgi:peroxiredoxin
MDDTLGIDIPNQEVERAMSQARPPAFFAALIIALVVGFSGQPAALAADDLGPAVGTVLDIGTPKDQTGTPRTMASLSGEKGIVFAFFRAASWCPYCLAQLIDLNAHKGDFEARGYKLAGMSYETPKVLAAAAMKHGLNFTLLSDPGSKIIDKYKLRDPQYKKGSLAYGVPRPIIFILGPDGVIKAKLFEATYKTRPSIKDILAALDN